MLQKLELIPVYIFTALFVGLNLFFCANNQYALSLIPLGLSIALFAIFSLDKLLILIAFFTPLSIELRELVPWLGFNMSLPTEPLLVTITAVFFVKLITEKKFDKRVLAHPISIMIYIYMFWMFFTSITSIMPIVSFKYSLSKVWFIVGYYFLVTQIATNEKNIKSYIWAYSLGLIIVVAITLSKHAYRNFDQHTANWICKPFFKDHTSYGAALAMIIPALVGIFKMAKKDFNVRFFYILAIGFLLLGLLFSYTRGAWGSIAAIIAIWVVVKLRIKLRDLILGGIISVIIAFSLKDAIMFKLEKNNEVSSSNLISHVKSMSNITTDASNLERINRWSCAYRMFLQKPFLGWGPGTYMFQYAPFQLAKERTIISTNAATLGNAHSDYLGALSEQGILGPVIYFLLLAVTMITGFNYYNRRTASAHERHLVLLLQLGLITYYMHGVINNFLDMDKISALFWGFSAIIVSLDIADKEKSHETISR